MGFGQWNQQGPYQRGFGGNSYPRATGVGTGFSGIANNFSSMMGGEESPLGQITHVGSSSCCGTVLPSTTVANAEANPVSRNPDIQTPADSADEISPKIHITKDNDDEKPESDTREPKFRRKNAVYFQEDTDEAEQNNVTETLAALLIAQSPEFSHIRKSECLQSLHTMSWQRKPEQPRITLTPNPNAPPPSDDEDSSETHDQRQSPILRISDR